MCVFKRALVYTMSSYDYTTLYSVANIMRMRRQKKNIPNMPTIEQQRSLINAITLHIAQIFLCQHRFCIQLATSFLAMFAYIVLQLINSTRGGYDGTNICMAIVVERICICIGTLAWIICAYFKSDSIPHIHITYCECERRYFSLSSACHRVISLCSHARIISNEGN